MKYLDLINKCLVELNYKQVSSFSELIKNEHKKLKNILNVLNSEICSMDKWEFLERKKQISLPKNTSEIENPIEGRIKSIIVDGTKLEYFEDFGKFYTSEQPANTYSLFDDKILLPIFSTDKNIEILYYTKNCAKTSDGTEVFSMKNFDDEPLIPDLFAEPILVFGACMRLKGNTQHVRFNYWLSMYKEALANLRSRISKSIEHTPSIKMFRH